MLIPTVKIETRLPVEGSSFGNKFSSIYSHCGIMASGSRKVAKICIIWRFWRKRPLTWKFLKFSSTWFIATPIDVLCSNFVKFGSWKIGKIVRCLSDKKQHFAQLSRSRYCSDRAQNVPEPDDENVPWVFQISPKSIHVWRSYTRARELHQNGS